MSTDLFVLKGCTYLLVVVFSRYPEIIQLATATTTSTKVIGALKSVFARHGIPEEVVSDNGPQFASVEMEFATHQIMVMQSVQLRLYKKLVKQH